MISCEIGTGTSFINVDGMTGIVVPPADPGALATAMQKLLTDPGLAQRMGANARQRANSVFSAPRMGADYAHLYRALVAQRRIGIAAAPIDTTIAPAMMADRLEGSAMVEQPNP